MQINIKDYSNKTITLIFGFSKFMFKDFQYNNIQLTGDWYLQNHSKDLKIVKEIIKKNEFSTINLIGTSKSNTGCFIFVKILSSIFQKIKFRIFAFSAYTTIEKSFYVENNLLEYIPKSLRDIWNNIQTYNQETIELADARGLENLKNVELFFLYPELSRGGECFS